MSSLKIETTDNRLNYFPKERIEGEVSWNLIKNPSAIEVRLFWYTAGKGTGDVKIIDAIRFSNPSRNETRSFSFTLPSLPYSFSGKLISLIWAIELIAEPENTSARFDFFMSSTGEEVTLERKTIFSESTQQSF